MKILTLVIISASLSLMGCATSTEVVRPNLDSFLQPCVIEGPHGSMREVMADPNSTTRSIVDFGGAAEDAVTRCNEDKAAAQRLLRGNQ